MPGGYAYPRIPRNQLPSATESASRTEVFPDALSPTSRLNEGLNSNSQCSNPLKLSTVRWSIRTVRPHFSIPRQSSASNLAKPRLRGRSSTFASFRWTLTRANQPVPAGTADLSPAFQRWVRGQPTPSPGAGLPAQGRQMNIYGCRPSQPRKRHPRKLLPRPTPTHGS